MWGYSLLGIALGIEMRYRKKEAILSNPLESEERISYESQKENAKSFLTLFFLKEERHVMGTTSLLNVIPHSG